METIGASMHGVLSLEAPYPKMVSCQQVASAANRLLPLLPLLLSF